MGFSEKLTSWFHGETIPGTQVPAESNGGNFPTPDAVESKVQQIKDVEAAAEKAKEEAKERKLQNLLVEMDTAIRNSFFKKLITEVTEPQKHYLTEVTFNPVRVVGNNTYAPEGIAFSPEILAPYCEQYKKDGNWARVTIEVYREVDHERIDRTTTKKTYFYKAKIRMYREYEEPKPVAKPVNLDNEDLFPPVWKVAEQYAILKQERDKAVKHGYTQKEQKENLYQYAKKAIISGIRKKLEETHYWSQLVQGDGVYIGEASVQHSLRDLPLSDVRRLELEFAEEGGWEEVSISLKRDSSYRDANWEVSFRLTAKAGGDPNYRDVGFQVDYLYGGQLRQCYYVIYLKKETDPRNYFSTVGGFLRAKKSNESDICDILSIYSSDDEAFYCNCPISTLERLDAWE